MISKLVGKQWFYCNVVLPFHHRILICVSMKHHSFLCVIWNCLVLGKAKGMNLLDPFTIVTHFFILFSKMPGILVTGKPALSTWTWQWTSAAVCIPLWRDKTYSVNTELMLWFRGNPALSCWNWQGWCCSLCPPVWKWSTHDWADFWVTEKPALSSWNYNVAFPAFCLPLCRDETHRMIIE